MAEFHGHVSAVAQEVLGDETTTALLAGATEIFVADTVDFYEEGGSVLIAGSVYTYSAMDDGEESNTPSITLDSGLLADLPTESRVDVWNASTGAVVTEWHATVTDDNDGSAMTAPLTHALVAMFSEGVGGLVGESVVCRTDGGGEWWVVEVVGGTPSYDPGFIRTGGLGADTVVWAGTENGRRAQLDGIDGALECYDSTNTQTVNLDGEDNFIEGTLATAASGPRIEMGPGPGALPSNEVRFLTDSADEVEPGYLRISTVEIDPGAPQGLVTLTAPEWDGVTSPPRMYLTTPAAGEVGSRAEIEADAIDLDAASVGVTGSLSVGSMSAGSVGTGTFRDSVDARVNTLVPAASDTAAGKVELATSAETITGTDTARAVTPAGLEAKFDDMGHIERTADNTQAITTGGSAQVVLWQTSAVTGRGGVSYDSGTGAFTVTTAGTYSVSAYMGFAANATGRRQFFGRVGGTTRSGMVTPAPSAGAWVANLSFIVDLAASDTIDFTAFQDSGGNLNVAQGRVAIHRVA